MLWRHLCSVRAWAAAGLMTCSMFAASALAEPAEPPPSADRVTETVKVLEARGIAISEAQRQEILDCRDLAQLDRWLARAVLASSVEEITAEP